jgi:hypothetical protein
MGSLPQSAGRRAAANEKIVISIFTAIAGEVFYPRNCASRISVAVSPRGERMIDMKKSLTKQQTANLLKEFITSQGLDTVLNMLAEIEQEADRFVKVTSQKKGEPVDGTFANNAERLRLAAKEVNQLPFVQKVRFFDVDKCREFLEVLVLHYEKLAPTVSRYADDVYIRLGDGEPVQIRELTTLRSLYTEDGWQQHNLAANLIYKLEHSLGRDLTGQCGY